MRDRFYVSEHAVAASNQHPFRFTSLQGAIDRATELTGADGKMRGVVEIKRIVKRECPTVVVKVTR